jgi:translation elongation factor EF-Ts
MMFARFLRQISRGSCSAHLRCMATSAEQLSAIKALREQSGAPISDVRAALMQADWKPGGACLHTDFDVCRRRYCCKCTVQPCSSLLTEDALQELRKKGLAASSKKVRRPLLPCAGCDVRWVARGNLMQTLTSLTSATAMQASRNAAQGLVGLASEGDAAVLVEVTHAEICCGSDTHTVTPQLASYARLDSMICVLQVNSETDFVARNDQFVGMVGQVAAAALHVPASGRQGADSDILSFTNTIETRC